jgi:hypothetical protein
MGADPYLPHLFGLTLVSQLGRMVYLAYMLGPNAPDKVKIMFKIWKSQNIAQPPPAKYITVMARNVHFPA